MPFPAQLAIYERSSQNRLKAPPVIRRR